jgi:ATP phosphoribosyltransferase
MSSKRIILAADSALTEIAVTFGLATAIVDLTSVV